MRSLREYVAMNRAYPWVKKGMVFEPGRHGYTHGSHPCAIHLDGDRFLVAYTQRDVRQRSHVFLSFAEVGNGIVRLIGRPTLALEPGAPCHFDCDGVISVCFVRHREHLYLYYVGWQNLPDGTWLCDTGRAMVDVDILGLRREFDGPVLGRDRNNPLFAAATAFHVSGDRWQTWYNSGVRWERSEQGWRPYYGIRHAISTDGIQWTCFPEQVIPFADEHEYAFGRPSVIEVNGIFYMWFAHRASETADTYRMGFAFSEDGHRWTRNDRLAGIDVSSDGWDSEMICYPAVFEHRGVMYMLYNGNGYGKTGFGLAVMEET